MGLHRAIDALIAFAILVMLFGVVAIYMRGLEDSLEVAYDATVSKTIVSLAIDNLLASGSVSNNTVREYIGEFIKNITICIPDNAKVDSAIDSYYKVYVGKRRICTYPSTTLLVSKTVYNGTSGKETIYIIAARNDLPIRYRAGFFTVQKIGDWFSLVNINITLVR